MKTFKRMLSALLAVVMLLAVVGCGGSGTEETTAPSSDNAAQSTYTVNLKSIGGMALPDIDVYVYADSTLTDLKQYGKTDENGQVSFQLAGSADYAVTLTGVPKGYEVEASYPFNGSTADITLTSRPVTGESLSDATLGLGDVMYDFSVVTPEGQTVTLSELLQEKQMVLLNFWYTTCTYCVAEFPYMEEAYKQYSDKVGIIAVNPLEDDSAVAAFREQYGLTFPMATCQPAWSNTFNVSGYPTSIIIDRYGVICLIEAGGITSLRPFVSIFDAFTAEDYEQKLYNSLSELVTNVKPTYEMDTSENIAAILGTTGMDITYRPETDEESAEYSWPFIAAEKNGETCLKASNQGIDGSYAILYADVYLKAGQAVSFDYLTSTELGRDVMYVIVNDEDIYTISGEGETEEWATCYPWVALEDGYYEVALCYLKDESNAVGDDTVYVRNVQIVSEEEIDTPSYIPRPAATAVDDGFEYSYVDVVLNEKDGYYHVGAADGPLLLADMMNYTQFNETKSVWDLVYDGVITVNGHNYYDELVNYCSYASNSALSGVCTVNEELAELLKIVADVAGFEDDENEWLKICTYFQAYGTDGEQFPDPIAGLASFSAYEAKLGTNVESNYFYYDRPIIPRGLRARFTPSQSGVYRITSRTDYTGGLDAWIFDENDAQLYVYEPDERMYNDEQNVSIVYYMEVGKSYYIDIAFWDMYNTGYIYYDIEYIAPTYNLFRLAAPGYFTYDSNATGDEMYHLISGGIEVVLGEDGYYHEDLGKDAGGKQIYGSILYCDFTGLTGLFDKPIATVDSTDENGNPTRIQGMIDLGAFDFTRNENDLYVLACMEKNNNDPEATDAYLREQWGESYDEYAELYQVEDVYEGKFHGEGKDLTEEARGYVSKIITGGSAELQGCVPVDARLAELLQMLMCKYTFDNVDDAWIKTCYYYDYLGPEN